MNKVWWLLAAGASFVVVFVWLALVPTLGWLPGLTKFLMDATWLVAVAAGVAIIKVGYSLCIGAS